MHGCVCKARQCHNGTRLKAASDFYGAIRTLPTIEDIAKMVHDFWTAAKRKNPRLRQQDLRIWKMDLRRAYTLLSFRPGDAGLFATLLTDDLVYLQLVGVFGWDGTPAAFQVVTRAISWELRHALQGHTLMYVDEVVGVLTMSSQISLRREISRRIRFRFRRDIGSGSVADDKTENGRKVLCVLTRSGGIARKNFLKALHGFATTNVKARINLKSAQRLASWGTRYGKMRPFCSYLYRVTWGRTSSQALFFLSSEAIVAVRCWRAMLSLVRFREQEFTRSIASFAPEHPSVVAEFDSSLSGSGVIWYARDSGTEVVLGVSAVDLRFLGFGFDSSNQNLAEYIGAIIAVLRQVMLGHSGRSLALRGDSMTALTWAVTERPRGTIVINASIVLFGHCYASQRTSTS
jgi:hypothetical protein